MGRVERQQFKIAWEELKKIAARDEDAGLGPTAEQDVQNDVVWDMAGSLNWAEKLRWWL